MISSPGPRLLRACPRWRRGERGESVLTELNLTPLVDMLCVLVIFGLLHFDAGGELLA